MSDIAFLENGFFMLREALSWSAPSLRQAIPITTTLHRLRNS